ncbi:VanZ family protein [Streptomyces sp. NPDC059247]|uniref:VanZ family protein n=1 Tax=Streptomyces sp. NPDC059247 TaxID=3346790 RepID=UPI0036A02844
MRSSGPEAGPVPADGTPGRGSLNRLAAKHQFDTLSDGYGTGRSVSPVPFKEFWAASSSTGVAFSEVTLVNFAGNMLLLVPFGGITALLWPPPRRTVKGVLTTAALSLAVEIAQYHLSLGRVSSADDVTLNTAGAAAGALLVRRWNKTAQASTPPLAEPSSAGKVR